MFHKEGDNDYNNDLTVETIAKWERVCSVCGKHIYVPCVERWAYKEVAFYPNKRITWYCGYTCMRSVTSKRVKTDYMSSLGVFGTKKIPKKGAKKK